MSFRLPPIALAIILALATLGWAADVTTSSTTTTTVVTTPTTVTTDTPPSTTVAPTSPSTNGTTEPHPTPTSAPEPTPEVPDFPPVGTYNLTSEDGNITCLSVQMALQFRLNGSQYVNVTDATLENPKSCPTDSNATLIVLKLKVEDDVLVINFERDLKDNSTMISNMTLTHVNKTETTNYFFNETLFKSTGLRGYQCQSLTKIESNQVNETTAEASLKNVKISNPFHITGKEATPNALESCPADDEFGDIVPIAVGIALMALVAIVLIAYFVGRRRSRRLAYQSV